MDPGLHNWESSRYSRMAAITTIVLVGTAGWRAEGSARGLESGMLMSTHA